MRSSRLGRTGIAERKNYMGRDFPPPAALPALLARLKDVPALVVHGAKDGVVPPDSSRQMTASAKQAGMNVRYVEVPDADHITVVGSSFKLILDFFDKAAKNKAGAS